MATDDDILEPVTPEDGYIELYECDEYEVRGYIVPIDGKVRPNIPVKIKEESNIYSSTSTNNNGYFSTSFYFPGSGTYTPQVVCGRLSEYVTGFYNTYISVLPCSINLTSTKDILSYAYNDTTTITATLICDDDNTAILSDREITFNVRKQSDSSIISTTTKTTDATGKAIFEYESQGIGDIYIEALCGVSVSKTYDIEDCTYYSTTTHSTTHYDFNVSLPNGAFTISYLLNPTNRSISAPYITIGDSDNDRMLVGQYARAGTNGLIIYKGSQTNLPHDSLTTLNADNLISFTYDGTDYIYSLNGVSKTFSNYNVTLNKLLHYQADYGGTIRNIKIKPL